MGRRLKADDLLALLNSNDATLAAFMRVGKLAIRGDATDGSGISSSFMERQSLRCVGKDQLMVYLPHAGT